VPAIESADVLPPPDPDAIGFVLDPTGRRSLGAEARGPAPASVWLAVGPESGFDPTEVERAIAAGWRGVAIGPRTLRTETAGIVAATLVLHAWGDLGDPAGV
jgi:RsmE family RNA methyltransferase